MQMSALDHQRTFHTLIQPCPLFGRNQTSRRDWLNVRLVPGPDIRLPALCGDLTFHHDRGLKTYEVAKLEATRPHVVLRSKRGRQSCSLIWRGALFFALMLAHQFFDFDSAFAHR